MRVERHLREQRESPRPPKEYMDARDVGQRRLWCQRLGCTEQELLSGIQAVGPVIAKLRLHLRIRRSVRAAIRHGRVYGSGKT